jgi:hypothetical protein
MPAAPRGTARRRDPGGDQGRRDRHRGLGGTRSCAPSASHLQGTVTHVRQPSRQGDWRRRNAAVGGGRRHRPRSRADGPPARQLDSVARSRQHADQPVGPEHAGPRALSGAQQRLCLPTPSSASPPTWSAPASSRAGSRRCRCRHRGRSSDEEIKAQSNSAVAAAGQKKSVHALWARWVTKPTPRASPISTACRSASRANCSLPANLRPAAAALSLRRPVDAAAARAAAVRAAAALADHAARTATGSARASSSTGSAAASPIISGASIPVTSRWRRSSASGCGFRPARSCTSSIRSRPARSAACRG